MKVSRWQYIKWWLHDQFVELGNLVLYLLCTFWGGFWLWLGERGHRYAVRKQRGVRR